MPVSLSFFTFCKIFVFFISWVQYDLLFFLVINSHKMLPLGHIYIILILLVFRLTLALNMQAIALVYTSATLAAAIVNSLPASTFFFAVQVIFEIYIIFFVW